MKTEKGNFDISLNSSNMKKILDYLTQKYGDISRIELKKYINGELQSIANFSSDYKMIYQIKENYLTQIDLIDIYFVKDRDSLKRMTFNMKTNEFVLKQYDTNIYSGKLNKEIIIPTQTIDQAMSDKDATYYKFDTGRIAKYNYKNGLYYLLNKKNEWELDGRVFSWLVGAEYDYEEILPSKKGIAK